MIRIVFFIACIALLSRCGSPSRPAENTSEPQQEQNIEGLSEAQVAEGWQLLFDGKTTNGWKIFKDRPNNTWEVVDGYLHCKPVVDGVAGADQRSDIMTIAEFGDFELSFDWKVAAEANSGVMFRVTEEYEQPYFTGPEYQIIDDSGYPGPLKETQKTGANYDMHATAAKKLNPAGSWNTGKIVAHGNHIEHWLNGQKIVEYEIGSEDWTKRMKESKWSEQPGYAKPTRGHIDFQDHGNEIWFRHIMIRELK